MTYRKFAAQLRYLDNREDEDGNPVEGTEDAIAALVDGNDDYFDKFNKAEDKANATALRLNTSNARFNATRYL